MWNSLNLTSPDHDICEYGKKDAATIESLHELVNILTSSAEILAKDHPIWEEIKIFKNIQTKYKRILHCDKCLQHLQRVGGYLRKMVCLNISTTYLDLADKIMLELKHKRDTNYFLPSRQQLEYVLIRTQASAKLLCESLHYSRETFCYLIQRLKVGHLIINLMMATSVTARLNIVLKGLLLQLYSAYKKIYPWRQRMKKGGFEWEKPLELPEDLESWINLEDSEYVKPRNLPKEELDFLTTIFDKNAPSDAGHQEIALPNGSSNEEECMVVDSEDNGVLIERSELEVIEPSPPQSPASILEIKEPTQSSSDELTAVSEQKLNLTKAQKVLRKKIKSAEDIKELKAIWENLDFSTQNLFPQAVTPEKIRLIDKMFLKVKRKISQLKKSRISDIEKQNEMDFLIKISRLKFAKTLGLLPTKENIKKKFVVPIKPVRTFKELKELYDTIYHKLQTNQDYKKCAKLKKMFKSRKADLKLLVESGEKAEGKKLIFITSKLFITDYL